MTDDSGVQAVEPPSQPGEHDGGSQLDLSVPYDEWLRVRRLLSIIDDDERSKFGFVHLSGDGRRRIWEATDSYRAARMWGGDDPNRYEVLVSPALVTFGAAMAAADEQPVSIRTGGGVDGPAQIGVTAGPGSLFVEVAAQQFPDLGAAFFDNWQFGAHARVLALELFRFVWSRHARVQPAEGENPAIGAPAMEFGVHDGHLRVSIEWDPSGPTDYVLSSDDAEGSYKTKVNPPFLQSVVELFDPSDLVDVQFPTTPDGPILFVGNDLVGVLMTMKSDVWLAREAVEKVIEEVAGPLAVVRDDDGDYPLLRRDAPVYGRFDGSADPLTLQVFAVVVHDVEQTPELLAELNDLNTTIGFARIMHTGGQILAEVDLVAETLDSTELLTAIDRVSRITRQVAPMLSVVHGGAAPADPASLRWQFYRQAIIQAETSPGSLVELNGPHAVETWPFPATVHVLTGWNPQGIGLGDARHQNINVQLATDILRQGGRFVHGFGGSSDQEVSEPSLIAWGLDRDTARRMGRHADQDAIFEIDADTMRVISCVDAQNESWPRRADNTG